MKQVLIIGANGRTAQEIIPSVLVRNDVHLTLFLRISSRLEAMKSGHVDICTGSLSLRHSFSADYRQRKFNFSALFNHISENH